MKNKWSKTLWIVGLGCLLPLMGSCGNPSAHEDADSIIIHAAKLGYGTDWLHAIADGFTKKTGIKVSITERIGDDGVGALNTELESHAGDTDIFFTRPHSYPKAVYDGGIVVNGTKYDCAYADLTDVYNTIPEGETKTIKEKMEPAYASYFEVNGKGYGMPWSGDGMMTFVRNKDAWKKLGLSDDQIPLTTDDMFTLADEIVAKKSDVAPFIYSFSDEYYTSILPVWFAQYEVGENINRFYEGKDPSGETSYNLYAYDGQERALAVLEKLLKGDGYQHKSSASLNFTSMQGYFMNGQAVFCANGDWLESEMNNYNAAIDVVKLPIISALSEKLSYYQEGKDTENNNKLHGLVAFVDAHPNAGDNTGLPEGTTAEDVETVRKARHSGSYLQSGFNHCILVPSYTDKLPEVKQFLTYFYSDEGLSLYYQTMKGGHLPAYPTGGYDTSAVQISSFRQSINAALEEGYLCDYDAHDHAKIYAIGGVNRYFNNGCNGVVNELVNNKLSAAAVIEKNLNYLKNNWSSINGKIA